MTAERSYIGDQNLPLNLPTKRRLCRTVGGRIVDGRAAHCCAVSTARSRAATMTNLARSSLALALPALFGAAKSCALVNLFMICPPWSTGDPSPDDNQILPLIHGYLMACSTHMRKTLRSCPAELDRMRIIRNARLR